MKQTAGFSKYAVAFTENTVDDTNAIEGPEELVEFIANINKKNKLTDKKTKVITTPNKMSSKNKTQSLTERKDKYLNLNKAQVQSVKKSNMNSKNEYDEKNVNSQDHNMVYDQMKNPRSTNSRGGGTVRGGNRGVRPQKISDDNTHPKHRPFDRHSGMTKSSVKPASKIHGRDDNNWKEEVDNTIAFGHDGTIHVEVATPSEKVTTTNNNIQDGNDEIKKPESTASNYYSRRSGMRFSRGNDTRGRNRRNDFKRNKHNTETNSKPKNERGNYSSVHHNNVSNKPEVNEASVNFVFDDSDFPSFDP